MTTWFTADHHFNHANIIKYCNRPFSSVEEMNEILIQRHNEVVKSGDIVFHLGDFTFGGKESIKNILYRLHGILNLIPGSHDSWRNNFQIPDDMKNSVLMCLPIYELKKFYDVVSDTILRLDNPITLCHYAMRTWASSHYNSWHLFAHSHGNLPSWGKSFDCGVDTHNFYPYSLEEVEEIMDKLPDNFNLVKE